MQEEGGNAACEVRTLPAASIQSMVKISCDKNLKADITV